jgi:hypothetical protein
MHLTRWADRKHHRLEEQVVKDASAVVVVGAAMKKEFEDKYGRSVQVITNGYDDTAAAPSGGALDAKFTLLHSGGLLRNRNPYSLWQALEGLVRDEPGFADALEIVLLGTVDATANAAIAKHGLDRHVRRIPPVPHAEALRVQSSAWVLLLPIDKLPNAEFVLSGKLFEYLRAARPILCIGPVDGDAAAVIRDTQAGETFGFDDVRGIRDHLKEQFRHYREGQAAFSPRGIDRYSGASLTRELSGLMDQLVARKEHA